MKNGILQLAGLKIQIKLALDVSVSDAFDGFVFPLNSEVQEHDISVCVEWDSNQPNLLIENRMGKDQIQEYYRQDGMSYCVIREAHKGIFTCVQHTNAFDRMKCTINDTFLPVSIRSLDYILRALPIRAIFQRYGVLFFHAAQIVVGAEKTGILFTAPSGTGKTTQAHLWMKEEGARLICNDRTLMRKKENEWKTYGYPIDGSEPVRSAEVHSPGCIVLLSQAPFNRVQRMSVFQAVGQLMPQLVIDGWNPEARTRGMEMLLEMMESIPVYHLECTPDTDAVRCLKQQLIKDGVLHE